jgi:hypothetical protein
MQYSDTSSEGNDLPVPVHAEKPTRGEHDLHIATPPSSSPRCPLDGDDADGAGDDRVEGKIINGGNGRGEGELLDSGFDFESTLSASLIRVVDRLESIQAKRDTAGHIPIPISNSALAALGFLLDCEVPLPRDLPTSDPAADSVVRKLRSTQSERISKLQPWFCRCRCDFYDGYLVLRMTGSVHLIVENNVGQYLERRLQYKLTEAGHTDYASRIRRGGTRLNFRDSNHEPDINIWLDDKKGPSGNDSEEDETPAAAESDDTPQPLGQQIYYTWPAVAVEIGWSHPTPDHVCKGYITKGLGHIRCVLRLNMEYIYPEKEHLFEQPDHAILDGWRVHPDGHNRDPVRFIDNLDILTSDQRVALTLNDVHQDLPATDVTLSVSKLAAFVREAFQRKKRARTPEPMPCKALEEEPGSKRPRR